MPSPYCPLFSTASSQNRQKSPALALPAGEVSFVIGSWTSSQLASPGSPHLALQWAIELLVASAQRRNFGTAALIQPLPCAPAGMLCGKRYT